MTELDELLNKVYQSANAYNDYDLMKISNRLYEVIKTLRNSDSSADNDKVEQTTTEEELMANIEDILSCYRVDINNNVFFTKDSFYQCHLDLLNLFKTHRNTVSTAANQKDDNLVDEDELRSKIESLIKMFDHAECYSEWFATETTNKLLKLFKTYQNSVLRPDIQQMNKYSSRGETESKIAFKNSIRFSIGQMVTADQELDQIVENIVEFFIDTVNPVFRALNDSDEQSIQKNKTKEN